MKTLTSITGFLSGSGLTLHIHWQHVAEKGIETFILALIGGIGGAIGGLIIAWAWKKIKQIAA